MDRKESLVHTVCACIKNVSDYSSRAMMRYDVLATFDCVLTSAHIALLHASAHPSVGFCVRTGYKELRQKETAAEEFDEFGVEEY